MGLGFFWPFTIARIKKLTPKPRRFLVRMSGLPTLCLDISRNRKTIVNSMSYARIVLLICKMDLVSNYSFFTNFNYSKTSWQSKSYAAALKEIQPRGLFFFLYWKLRLFWSSEVQSRENTGQRAQHLSTNNFLVFLRKYLHSKVYSCIRYIVSEPWLKGTGKLIFVCFFNTDIKPGYIRPTMCLN